MTEPTTEAGKALGYRPLIHTAYCYVKNATEQRAVEAGDCICDVTRAIVAIEQEAREDADAYASHWMGVAHQAEEATQAAAARELVLRERIEVEFGYGNMTENTRDRLLAAAAEWPERDERVRAEERAKVYGVLGALEDGQRPPGNAVIAAVTELVREPGPSNNLAWAFVAFAEAAVNDWLQSADGKAHDEQVRAEERARFRAEKMQDAGWAIDLWLQSEAGKAHDERVRAEERERIRDMLLRSHDAAADFDRALAAAHAATEA